MNAIRHEIAESQAWRDGGGNRPTMPLAPTLTLGIEIPRQFAHGTIILVRTEVFAMGNQLELLEAEALKLTASERAAFAQLLLASLDEDSEIAEAWAEETERRISDIESGAVQVIPIADALAEVRAALK